MELVTTPHQLANVWPEVEPWIAAAIEEGQGDENTVDVLIAIAQGRYWLWHEPKKFAGVVQINDNPRQKVATILYAGGSDLEGMKKAVEWGKGWCKERGISQIRVWGRKGWERVLEMKRKGVILQVGVT